MATPCLWVLHAVALLPCAVGCANGLSQPRYQMHKIAITLQASLMALPAADCRNPVA